MHHRSMLHHMRPLFVSLPRASCVLGISSSPPSGATHPVESAAAAAEAARDRRGESLLCRRTELRCRGTPEVTAATRPTRPPTRDTALLCFAGPAPPLRTHRPGWDAAAAPSVERCRRATKRPGGIGEALAPHIKQAPVICIRENGVFRAVALISFNKSRSKCA